MEVFAMKPPTDQSADAAPDATSGRALAGVTRRTAIKSLGVTASALLIPAAFSAAASTANLQAKNLASNPKWYGFNLLEYFSTDADWMKYFPYKNDGLFQEDDFR